MSDDAEFIAAERLRRGGRLLAAISFPGLPDDPVDDANFCLFAVGPEFDMLDPGRTAGVTAFDRISFEGVVDLGTDPALGFFFALSLSAVPMASARTSMILSPLTRNGLL